MITQFYRKSLFLKSATALLMLNFILGSPGVNTYANVDKLRPQAAKSSNPLTSNLAQDLLAGRILVLSNNISLHRGAQTGGYNMAHAISDGAQGGIFNHSERRLRIETAMMNTLRSLRSIDKKSEEKIEAIWKNALKTENLSDIDIAATLGWLDDFQGKSRDEQAIELLGRRLTNYIINLQLKEVIAYSNKIPISQTVLCVGETHQQYLAKRTTEVLETDLEEMLDGIALEDAQKIGLRIAYEPRWAIGTGLTPTLDEIQSVHQFIKRTTDFILGRELDVDYGGSLNKGNAERILALPDVDGGLIGGAAKKPVDILPIIEEAIKQGRIKNKILNVGMNWKAEIETTGLAPIIDFVELFLGQDLSGVRIVISTPQVATLRTALARQIRNIAGGAGEPASISSVPALLSFGEADLKGKRVLVRSELNIPDPNSIHRIRTSVRAWVHIIENGGTPVVLFHYGRPGGKVDPKLSVSVIAPLVERVLKEEGYADIKVVTHQGSITEKGVTEGTEEKIVQGAINLLDNTRFCAGDERNDPVFARQLARLGDIFIFDGFGAGERVHASTAGLARYVSKIALGPVVISEESMLRGAVSNLQGVIFGGGPKVSEKMGSFKRLVENIKEGGFLVIGSGPAPAFLKAHKDKDYEGIELAQKPKDEDVKSAREILELAKTRKITVVLPVDFMATTENLAGKSKLPEGVKLFLVSRDELMQGKLTLPSGKLITVDKIFVCDIGPKSIAENRDAYLNTPAKRSIVWNGPLGIFEIEGLDTGTRATANDLAEVTQNGVITVAGGGDTIAATEKFEVAGKLSHVSTGGGASLALLEGRELLAVEELNRIQSDIDATEKVARELKIDVANLWKFIWADNAIYAGLAGKAFDEYVKSLQSSMSPTQAQTTYALIISQDFLKLGGLKNALAAQVAQLSSTVKIGLYGEDAEELGIILGNKDIVTGQTLGWLIAKLEASLGIQRSNIVVLTSTRESWLGADIKQVVAKQLSTVAVAKALHTLLGNDAAFAKFYEEVKKAGVISEQTYANTKEALLAKLEKGIFELPAIELTPQTTTQLERERLETEEFISQV